MKNLIYFQFILLTAGGELRNVKVNVIYKAKNKRRSKNIFKQKVTFN